VTIGAFYCFSLGAALVFSDCHNNELENYGIKVGYYSLMAYFFFYGCFMYGIIILLLDEFIGTLICGAVFELEVQLLVEIGISTDLKKSGCETFSLFTILIWLLFVVCQLWRLVWGCNKNRGELKKQQKWRFLLWGIIAVCIVLRYILMYLIPTWHQCAYQTNYDQQKWNSYVISDFYFFLVWFFALLLPAEMKLYFPKKLHIPKKLREIKLINEFASWLAPVDYRRL